jgi:hypothetical protein
MTAAEYEAELAALRQEIVRLEKYRQLLVTAIIRSIPNPTPHVD